MPLPAAFIKCGRMPHPPETRHIIRIKSDKITFVKMAKSGFPHAENFRIHLIFEFLWDSCDFFLKFIRGVA